VYNFGIADEKTKARKHDHSSAAAEIFPGGGKLDICLSFLNC